MQRNGAFGERENEWVLLWTVRLTRGTYLWLDRTLLVGFTKNSIHVINFLVFFLLVLLMYTLSVSKGV